MPNYKITDWIQSVCAILVAVAAFWALFSWKSQKQYEVEILAMSSIQSHFDFFFNLHKVGAYSLSELDIDSVNTSESIIYGDIIKQFPKLETVLYDKNIYIFRFRNRQDAYQKMLEEATLIRTTFNNKKEKRDIVTFYDTLLLLDRGISLRYHLLDLILLNLKFNSELSKVERDKEFESLQIIIDEIIDSQRKVREDYVQLYQSLICILDTHEKKSN